MRLATLPDIDRTGAERPRRRDKDNEVKRETGAIGRRVRRRTKAIQIEKLKCTMRRSHHGAVVNESD